MGLSAEAANGNDKVTLAASPKLLGVVSETEFAIDGDKNEIDLAL